MPQQIAIATSHSGFCLSDIVAYFLGYANPGEATMPVHMGGVARNDPRLIQTLEMLGSDASRDREGFSVELHIVTIPDDVDWIIEDYDGDEWVAEVHRTWRW